MTRTAIAIVATMLLASCSQPSGTATASMDGTVADAGRPLTDKARDATLKPIEILSFAGVKTGDVVVEYVPGNGYWTRLLSKAVGAKGKVYDVVPLLGRPILPQDEDGARKNPADPVLAIENISDYANLKVFLEGAGLSLFNVPEQADIVWSSLSYHDLHNANLGPQDMQALTKAIFASLKPGGVFVVIDNAAAPSAGFGATATLHRADKEAVKNELAAVGFVFDGESNILANAGDDHTSVAMDNGEGSDKFALRFKKPDNAPKDARPGGDALANYYGNSFVLNVGPNNRRPIWYNKDGSYQEFGPNDMQAGTWYFDALGQICLYHEFPLHQRSFITCHPFDQGRKVGENWSEKGGGGRDIAVTLQQGHVYP